MARYVKQSKWIEIGKRMAYSMCAYCKKQGAQETAHAIRHKRYNKPKMHKYIDVEENACPVCHDCQKLSETREGRLIAWDWLCEKFGYEHMKNWHDNLPFLIKESFNE